MRVEGVRVQGRIWDAFVSIFQKITLPSFITDIIPSSYHSYPSSPNIFPQQSAPQRPPHIIQSLEMIGYELSKPQISKAYFFVSIRISRCYFYFYILQIIISLSLLISLLLNHQTLSVTLQIIACLLLACDLQLRCIAQGCSSFLKSRLNIVDLSVLFIILCMVAVEFLLPEVMHHPQEDVSLAMLLLRYLVQLWRVIELSKESKKQFEINTLEEIDLNGMHTEENDSECRV